MTQTHTYRKHLSLILMTTIRKRNKKKLRPISFADETTMLASIFWSIQPRRTMFLKHPALSRRRVELENNFAPQNFFFSHPHNNNFL